MATIKWKEDFSVGVQEIDNQHKKLIDIINKLFSMYEKDEFENTKVGPVFKDLEKYADEHFATEEHYFRVYNYEKKDDHINMHRSYINKLSELKLHHEQGQEKDTLFAINNFLNEWWIWHINHADQEYSDYFIANGLS